MLLAGQRLWGKGGLGETSGQQQHGGGVVLRRQPSGDTRHGAGAEVGHGRQSRGGVEMGRHPPVHLTCTPGTHPHNTPTHSFIKSNAKDHKSQDYDGRKCKLLNFLPIFLFSFPQISWVRNDFSLIFFALCKTFSFYHIFGEFCHFEGHTTKLYFIGLSRFQSPIDPILQRIQP